MDAQPTDMPRTETADPATPTLNDEVVTCTEDAIITDMVHSALCQIQAPGTWGQPLAQQPTA